MDGTGGIAVAIVVDNADIRAQVDGKLTAEDPNADVLAFTAQMVDTGGGTITIDVPLHLKLSRGSGSSTAGAVNLTDGDTYTVLEVEDTTGAATGFVRQKVTLSNGLSIGLDARQTDAASMHKLEQLGLKTFASSKVSEHPTTSNLVIDLTGLQDGDLVTYREAQLLVDVRHRGSDFHDQLARAHRHGLHAVDAAAGLRRRADQDRRRRQ